MNDDIETPVEIVKELEEYTSAEVRPPLLSRRVSSLNEAASTRGIPMIFILMYV